MNARSYSHTQARTSISLNVARCPLLRLNVFYSK